MAALLTSILDNTDKMLSYLKECEQMKIKILPPDINKSFTGFTVEDGCIRFGFLGVKNLGRGVMEALVQEREQGGPFNDLDDLCDRMYGKDLNRRAVESLIKCGALDSFVPNRRTLLDGYQVVMLDIEDRYKNNLEGQMNLFDELDPTHRKHPFQLPKKEEFPPDVKLAMEKEVTGLYVSGHPLAQYREIARQLETVDLEELLPEDEEENSMGLDEGKYRDGDIVRVLCIVTGKKTRILKRRGYMAFITLEDTSGSIEMLVFPPLYDQYRELLEENQVLYIEARLSIREEDTKLVCRAVATPQSEQAVIAGGLHRHPAAPQAQGRQAAGPPQARQAPGALPAGAIEGEPGVFKIGAVPRHLRGGGAGLLLFPRHQEAGLRAAEAVDHLQQPAVLPVGEDFREGECGGCRSREGAE